jgi:hypothetical protein
MSGAVKAIDLGVSKESLDFPKEEKPLDKKNIQEITQILYLAEDQVEKELEQTKAYLEKKGLRQLNALNTALSRTIGLAFYVLSADLAISLISKTSLSSKNSNYTLIKLIAGPVNTLFDGIRFRIWASHHAENFLSSSYYVPVVLLQTFANLASSENFSVNSVMSLRKFSLNKKPVLKLLTTVASKALINYTAFRTCSLGKASKVAQQILTYLLNVMFQGSKRSMGAGVIYSMRLKNVEALEKSYRDSNNQKLLKSCEKVKEILNKAYDYKDEQDWQRCVLKTYPLDQVFTIDSGPGA